MDATEMTLTTFAAPILKTDEILLCLNECNIQLSEAELMEPQRYKDQIKGVFLSLLETCMGITTSDLVQPPSFESVQCLSNPQLFEEAVSELAFLRATMKLMRTCGVMDFGLKDFQHPTSRRLRKQLSAVINLIKFREDRLQMYRELNDQRMQIVMDVKEATEENEMARQQLEELKSVRENQRTEMDQIENDNMDLETEIAYLNKQQAAIRQESGDLKKVLNQLKDETATATVALQEAKAEQRRLEAQVVQSPQRKKHDMENTTRALEHERHARNEEEKKVEFGKTCIINLENVESSLIKSLGILNEASKEQNKYKEIEREINQAVAKVDSNKKKTEELQLLINESAHELQRNEERISRLRQQAKAKREAAEESLDNAHSELIDVEKKRSEGLARLEEIKARLEKKREETSEEHQSAVAELNRMVEAYKMVESTVIKEMHRRNKCIAAIS